jgi:hypothetical protein
MTFFSSVALRGLEVIFTISPTGDFLNLFRTLLDDWSEDEDKHPSFKRDQANDLSIQMIKASVSESAATGTG